MRRNIKTQGSKPAKNNSSGRNGSSKAGKQLHDAALSNAGLIERIEIAPNKRATLRKTALTNKAVDDSMRNMLTNDPSFYNHNPAMLNTSVSASFLTAAGNVIDLSGTVEVATPTAIPGIMVFDMIPGIGYSADGSSAANIAANNIYAYVRHDNSGAKVYEPSDLMMYILAMDEAYMWFEYGKRTYGLATTYSAMNKYVPAAVVQACGFNFNDVQSNLGQFNFFLNLAVAKLNSLHVPKQFSLLERHSRLYRGVYTDLETGKAQFYLMRPRYYRGYVETEGAGMLQANLVLSDSVNGSITVEQWWSIMEALVNGIRNSEDCGTISGDLLKSYGSGSMITVNPVPINYAVFPVQDTELLYQFRNASSFDDMSGVSIPLAQWNYVQNTGINQSTIIYTPTGTAPNTSGSTIAYGQSKAIDLPITAPTPMDIMEATRLMFTVDFGTPGDTTRPVMLTTMGSEIVGKVQVYTLSPTTGNLQSVGVFATVVSTSTSSATVQTLMLARSFDYRPTQYYIGTGLTSSGKLQLMQPCGDLNNVGIISKQALQQTHLTAILSEFSVPIN